MDKRYEEMLDIIHGLNREEHAEFSKRANVQLGAWMEKGVVSTTDLRQRANEHALISMGLFV